MKKTKALVNRLLEELEKTGIAQIACDKVGVSRNSFYRWMKEDQDFLERVNEAKSLGEGVVSDVALSNVITGIKNRDAMFTKYWLSHRHPDFRRPFVHKTDTDVLAYFRALMEASKTRQIREEISGFADPAYEEEMNQAKEDAEKFFQQWGVPVEKNSKKKPPKAT